MISLLKNPRDREERMVLVQRYLAALGLGRYRAIAIVFGSLGRGDFTAESDTDLLVISDELPANPKSRPDMVFTIRDMAPELEPIGWREAEWARREGEGDPFIAVPMRDGVATRQ
jgi:predicted nucleotidyltransferase